MTEETVEQQLIVDTTHFQLRELIEFADVLGFKPAGKSFVRVRGTGNALLRTVTTLSFANMSRIFNEPVNVSIGIFDTETEEFEISKGGNKLWAKCGKYMFFALNDSSDGEKIVLENLNLVPFYAEDVIGAYEQKEIHRVKLQSNKKGDVSALSSKVSFIDEENSKQFQEWINIHVAAGDTELMI